MTHTPKFGSRSTADAVLAGIDLTGKHILVTGCDSPLGLATTTALAANGAHIIATAQSMPDAARTCRQVAYKCSPLQLDLGDLDSVASAAEAVRLMQKPLDAIIANAEVRHLANHVAHFALVNELAPLVRDATGRIVILAGERCYEPATFGAQLKLANALYARELARRLKDRGVMVNAVNPGKVRNAALDKPGTWIQKLGRFAAAPFSRTAEQRAATIALLAASPSVDGITGKYWQDCAIAPGSPLLDDTSAAARLWTDYEKILADHRAWRSALWPVAA